MRKFRMSKLYAFILGLSINDILLSADVDTIAVGTLVTFTVSWSRGTDVIFVTDYDDGEWYSWAWNTDNHTTSYGSKSVTFTHTFNQLKNHTVRVDVSNGVTSLTLDTLIIVEPLLDDVLNISTDYTPKAVPTVVNFDIQSITIPGLTHFHIWCILDYNVSSTNPNETIYSQLSSDAPLRYTYVYTNDDINVTFYLACENHISMFSHSGVVRLQEPFSDVSLSVNGSAALTGSIFFFDLYIGNGSHPIINITYGDTVYETYNNYNAVLSFSASVTLEHAYLTAGIYTDITVYLKNYYYDIEVSVAFNIVIQNPVVNLVLTASPSLVGIPPANSNITVHPDSTSGALPPSSVNCQWNLSSGVNIDEYSSLISAGSAESKIVTFDRRDVGSSHSVNVSCYNLVSRQSMHVLLSIQEVISDVSFIMGTYFIPTGGTVTVNVTAFTGSHVEYEIDSGDGILSMNSTELFSVDELLRADVTYYNTGNFTIRVTASNAVSNSIVYADENITVRNPIILLNLSSNFSVLWTPGIVDYIIASPPEQSNLTNIHCHFQFEQEHSASVYINELLTGDLFHYSHTFPRSHIGNITANVSCNNMVSDIIISSVTWLILDEVIISAIRTNDSVLLTNTTYFSLDIQRFGTKSCFQFIMGDSSIDTLYGSDVLCEDYATEHSMGYVPISFGEMTIAHEYIYEYFAHFNASVYAFNHVSNDTIFVDAWVKDWPCYWPNITMPDNVSDETAPLTMMRSEYFEILPYVLIDCMKTHISESKWTIKLLNPTAVALEILDEDFFVHEPRLLHYGTYLLEYNVSMYEVDDRWNISEAYIRIIPTPLIINETFAGNNYEILYNSTISIDALDYTIDLDVDSSDKSGLTFQWFCREMDEMFSSSFETVPMNDASVATSDDIWVGGCFGAGPGK